MMRGTISTKEKVFKGGTAGGKGLTQVLKSNKIKLYPHILEPLPP